MEDNNVVGIVHAVVIAPNLQKIDVEMEICSQNEDLDNKSRIPVQLVRGESPLSVDSIQFTSLSKKSLERSPRVFRRLLCQDPWDLVRNRGVHGQLGHMAGYKPLQGARQDFWHNQAPRLDRVQRIRVEYFHYTRAITTI